MAIAIIDSKKKELQFAGANRPLFLFRKKEQLGGVEGNPYLTFETDDYELYTLKGDKQPIGVNWEEYEFTNHLMKIQEHDSLYLFTDGFVDQFGGEKRKKFKTRNFKNLLLSVQEESMKNQKRLIEEAFNKWRGSHEQIDDVSVIGVRL